MIDSSEGVLTHPDIRIVKPSVVMETEYFHFLTECISAGFENVPMDAISTDATLPAITFGANPCFAGAAYSKDGKGIYIFHSDERIFPKDLTELIHDGLVFGGIVGGSPASYRKSENIELLSKGGIQLIPPPEDDFQASFAVAADPSKSLVRYSYNSRLYRLQQAANVTSNSSHSSNS